MIFTAAERNYLLDQFLARLATVHPDGSPQLRPTGFRLNADDTIDLGGPWLANTQRYRNLRRNPRLALVVDDMTPDGPDAVAPGMGRGVEIRGRGSLLAVDDPPVAPEWFGRDIIRVSPTRVISWHLDPENPEGSARGVPASSQD